jgi:anti-sigma factor ChrR (cupin superfamily)
VTHATTTDDVLETASLYVLGALPPDERAAFERHLAEGCRTCAREVASLGAVVGDLGHAAPARAPRREVRDRLLERVANPVTLLRASEGDWQREATGLDGRALHHDAREGRATSLVRVPPGGGCPQGALASAEQLYVLAGEVTIEGERLGVGDFAAASAPILGRATAGEAGCTLLVVTSGGDAATPGRPAAGLAVVRAADGDWRPGPVAGVEIRRLRADRARGTITGVVRIAPGARLPGHRHVTAEQLYMLSGDAHIGPLTFEAGDYYRTPEGTAHGATDTERGCEFLLIDSAVEFAAAR